MNFLVLNQLSGIQEFQRKKRKLFGMVLQQERLKLLLARGHQCFCRLKI